MPNAKKGHKNAARPTPVQIKNFGQKGNDTMIKRCEKLAFMKVGSTDVYTRMKGFTELSVSKNPKEYSRKYIDEDMERSAVVGYSPAMTYKLDLDPTDSVHSVFANIADHELTGDEAVKSVAIVDVSSLDTDGKANAIIRNFTIIPSSEGDDSDTYTAGGTMKAAGEITFGKAATSDSWATVTITENN